VGSETANGGSAASYLHQPGNLNSQLTATKSRTNFIAEGVGGVSCSALSVALKQPTIRSSAESAVKV